MLQEHLMEGSYMKSVRLVDGGPYFVGPLARLTVNRSFGSTEADKLLTAFKERIGTQCTALDAVEARLIEMVYCAEKINSICKDGVLDGRLNVPCPIGRGRYRSMVEAPRGILIHDYTADDAGKVTAANLIVATQNNYDAIDRTITSLARTCKPSGEERKLFDAMEFAVRCFDPCLSCATHMAGRMPLRIERRRNGIPYQIVTRGE
jgi:F420-non-reducing hydrogenase large subunit